MEERNYYNLDPTNTAQKVRKFPKMIISLLFIIILIITIFLALEFTSKTEDSSIIEGESLPLKTKTCQLESPVKQKIKMNKGEKRIIQVSGFQGSLLDVTWTIKDLKVASTSLPKGDSVTITAHNKGTTEIIATDTSVGDNCKIYTFLEVV